MTDALRIKPEEVFPRVKSGEAVLVCAYNDDEQYRKMQLEGSISLAEFYARLPRYAKDKEIVFYCA
jgi:hypothetical protein